ncbi:blast:DNA-binding protein Ewg [Drosophila guanche]|uniref:Blast:DNA-binding protein Ewg n=1 Tax=Drosophila guanche TaxID=7266 RepID=A0A3B0KQG6_DROGU|nr:blast:DNA-binding protein Ewg [Drosophila guanche]
MLDEDQSLGSDDDEEDLISSDGSLYDGDLGSIPVNDDVAHQLAAAGPVGVAAAAAIASSKKRKRPHCFETNPSVRKRQQNRLLRKLRGIIYEFTGRVGKQAVVLVATPGKPNTSYKVFGAKPLEDVLRNLKNIVMDELDNALAQQAPPPPQDDPSLFELPGLVIDGIPTPVEKMTQAQLRAFIPLMLKYSTGRGKPGWGRESTRPPWWPKELPWANVRMDARSEDDKQKVGGISWTHALRKIVINCYKYHGREDLLPTFADDDDKVNALISQSGDEDEDMELSSTPTIHTVTTMTPPSGNSNYTTQTVLSQNADGTVSLIQVDPNNPIITLSDGTTAQVQGVATLHQGEGGATIQTVQSLTDVNGHENMTVDLTETQDGQIYITTEDGQGYPVSVSNVISVPVSMYQSVMANMQQLQTNSDGTVCLAPMQVDTSATRTSSSASGSQPPATGPLQCYSLISAGHAVLGRRGVGGGGSGSTLGHHQQSLTLQAAPVGARYYLAAAPAAATTANNHSSSSNQSSSSAGFNLHQNHSHHPYHNNNNNSTLPNNNNNSSNSIKRPLPILLASPISNTSPTAPTTTTAATTTRSTRRVAATSKAQDQPTLAQKRRKTGRSSRKLPAKAAGENSASGDSPVGMGSSSSSAAAAAAAIRCVDSASLTNMQLQLPARTIKLENFE